MFHDVGWPHAFRDDYFAREQIPGEHQHPVAGPDESQGLYPGRSGLHPGGLPYPRSAAREGGPRNGVRSGGQGLRRGHGMAALRARPAFFGFGVVWHEDAPWAERLAEFLEPWDENPVIERLEANRVRLLADMHVQAAELRTERERRPVRRRSSQAARVERLRARASGCRGCVSAPGSRPARCAITRAEIRRALRD